MSQVPDRIARNCIVGEDWTLPIVIEGENLSTAAGATWVMEIHRRAGAPAIATPTVTATFSSPDTAVTFAMTDTVTAAITPQWGTYAIKSTLAGNTRYWWHGPFEFEGL